MDEFLWAALIVGVIFAIWIYKLIAHGGYRGAMFGARIKSTVGEIEFSTSRLVKEKFVIYRLESEQAIDSPSIGLELRQTTVASYQMQPVPLTKSQARALSQLLAKAAE